jgi:hypothetical protein
VQRTPAAFHLDRLATAGLLEVGYRRLAQLGLARLGRWCQIDELLPSAERAPTCVFTGSGGTGLDRTAAYGATAVNRDLWENWPDLNVDVWGKTAQTST